MELPEYEYKGLMAEAWDVLRGDTSDWPDRFFYMEIIQKFGQPVLDIGCGTGRLLLDFLLQGVDIDGVDNSPEMLDLCRQKAKTFGLSPVLYKQYLETLSLPRQYRTILIPSSTIQLVIKPDLVAESLKRLYEHLLPGGALAASVMKIWKEGDPLFTEWEKTAERASDGAQFRRVSRAWYNPDTELEDTEDLYQLIVNGKVVQEETHKRSPATRSYTQEQARELFESAGFDTVELFSEFSFDPVRLEDSLYSVVAVKGSAP